MGLSGIAQIKRNVVQMLGYAEMLFIEALDRINFVEKHHNDHGGANLLDFNLKQSVFKTQNSSLTSKRPCMGISDSRTSLASHFGFSSITLLKF